MLPSDNYLDEPRGHGASPSRICDMASGSESPPDFIEVFMSQLRHELRRAEGQGAGGQHEAQAREAKASDEDEDEDEDQ